MVHQPVSRGLAVFADASGCRVGLAEISADLRETVAHQRCLTTMHYTNPRTLLYIGVMRSQRLVTVDSWRYINLMHVCMYVPAGGYCFGTRHTRVRPCKLICGTVRLRFRLSVRLSN